MELLAAVGAEPDVAVERRLDRRRLDGPGRADDRRAPEQRADVLGVAVRGDGHHLGDREVDVVAVARPLRARRGRGRDRHRRERARQPLAGATTGLERHAAHRTAPDEPARLGLHDELAGRALGVRPGAPVRRDRAHDEARVRVEPAAADRTPTAAKLSTTTSAPATQLLDLGVTGAADHRPHAVVEELEQRAALLGVDGRAAGRPRAPRITAGRFDLHHVGAGVGEQSAAVRARDPGAEIDDAERRQPLLHGSDRRDRPEVRAA